MLFRSLLLTAVVIACFGEWRAVQAQEPAPSDIRASDRTMREPVRLASAHSSRPTPHWPIGFRRADASASTPDSPRGASSEKSERPLALPPRKIRTAREGQAGEARTPSGSLTTIFASLALVLGLFFLVVWITRRTLPSRSLTLPKEVVEVLGRTPLQGRQQMQLVRLGHKLILLSITPTGAESLAEIADPDEVQRLVALCQESQPQSVSNTFRQILTQLGNEPHPRGFLGDSRQSSSEQRVVPTRGRARFNEDADA